LQNPLKKERKGSLQKRTSNSGTTVFEPSVSNLFHWYVQGQKGKLIDSICAVERIDFKKLGIGASPKIESEKENVR